MEADMEEGFCLLPTSWTNGLYLNFSFLTISA
jgi:hypothetical protein